ncbi:C6 finger domain protein [Ascosphaera apis ARSEF 7405]|uniref:C6 finger domain protein n=1 Tax=Ascosphaera apis ARSEF 7405 TaxID=392613 RepID=A0A168AGJ6_9EURO|nr:C6 finger domain protein [Ascosphaera apis ARSEF 7405]
MATDINKRPRSLSGDSPSFHQMNQPPSKLSKTSHSSIPSIAPPSPPPQAQINYLARQSPDVLPLINSDDSLPSVLRLINEYDGILHRGESIAGNLGQCTLGPMLVKRFERMFDAPPKVLKSHGDEDASVSWLDVVEFAKSRPEQFNLEKTRNGTRICQIHTKQCRVEISEEDYRLIKSGMPQNIIPPQPILEDEEQELDTLALLEKKLGHIIQLADQVSARARQLNHRLQSRRSAINARRQNDVNIQAHFQLQQRQIQQLEQADPATATRLAKQASWLGEINGTPSYPLTPEVESTNALASAGAAAGAAGGGGGGGGGEDGGGGFSGTNRPPTADQRAAQVAHGSTAGTDTASQFSARKADQHLDNILSATSFFPSGNVPENVTIINGTSIRDASPSTRSELMRKFLSTSELAVAAAATDGPNGSAHPDYLKRLSEDESRHYRPLMAGTAPRGVDEARPYLGYSAHQPSPHHLHYHRQQPRPTDADVSKSNADYTRNQLSVPSNVGPSAPKNIGVMPIQSASTLSLQHIGPSYAARQPPAVKSPPRAGQPVGRSRGQSHARDDGGPFKIQMMTLTESLERGDTIVPPCDRCRRLNIACEKHMTACRGCTKKHAKCSWKNVKPEELQDDRHSTQSSTRPQKSEKKKRNSPGAKGPSSGAAKSNQTTPTLAHHPGSLPDGTPQVLPSKSPRLLSQQTQENPPSSMGAAPGRRASSISAGAQSAHSNIAPESMIHTSVRESSMPSPLARPHSVSANPGYQAMNSYHTVSDSPSSAPSTLPSYTTGPAMSNASQPIHFMSPALPASSHQQQQHQPRPQPLHFTDIKGTPTPSITLIFKAVPWGEHTREYDSARVRENIGRLDHDPVSLAISDTVAQHIATRAAAEANGSVPLSARRGSMSAASASAASAASASPGRTAMTPLSTGVSAGPAQNKAAPSNADNVNSNNTTSTAASAMGPMLSPSSGPADAQRAPSPLDVTANESASFCSVQITSNSQSTDMHNGTRPLNKASTSGIVLPHPLTLKQRSAPGTVHRAALAMPSPIPRTRLSIVAAHPV